MLLFLNPPPSSEIHLMEFASTELLQGNISQGDFKVGIILFF